MVPGAGVGMPARSALRLVILGATCVALAGCAARRTPQIDPPQAGRPAEEREEGIPRPPTRGELLEIGDLPSGRAVDGGIPGSDARVNQDASAQAQNETTIVASPANPQNLVGAWNDYFAINPGQNTVIGYGWSADGGQTWQSSRVNFATLPLNQSTGDPALAVDSQGDFYLGILAYSGAGSGILVSKSTDGGATFAEPVRLDNGGDKEFLTVDPSNDNVYVVWENSSAVGQAIFFSTSTDRGATFTPRLRISNAQSSGNGAYPAVGPDGEIYVVWGNFSTRLYFDRSLDQGATWLAAEILPVASTVEPRNPLQGGFRNPLIPAIAVDRSAGPYRGRIYVVWADQRFGDPDILLVWSSDRGDTWSAPVRVNDDAPGNNADQFFPWVAVDGDGAVHVTFLDRRDDPNGLLFSMQLATSTDGGQTFGPNVRLSDGTYGPSNFGFLGDYTGAAVSGAGKLHPLWPDGRQGDTNVFSRAVDLDDFDLDGVLNDGSADGQYANLRCAGGIASGCDDNCPGSPNPDQLDQDADAVGDACDNCAASSNAAQTDFDRDGIGDACDACPGQVGGDASDSDLDGVVGCLDNCLAIPNPDQEDADGDRLGDACDLCPATAANDVDGDGVCGDVDNCPAVSNAIQGDVDGDGVGDRCDVCPALAGGAQIDVDGDGAGDDCDCQPFDRNDRAPEEVSGLAAERPGDGSTSLTWTANVHADAYSVVRGDLAGLAAGSYGACLAEGVVTTSFVDPEVPATGLGFAYLVQAQNFDCGLGSLGFMSNDAPRGAGPCAGQPVANVYPDGDEAVVGMVSGTLADVTSSNGAVQAIVEERSSGGKPTDRYSVLEHRWSWIVPAGARQELHVEGFRSPSSDGDDFAFEISIDGGGTWTRVELPSLPTNDDDSDRFGALPFAVSGDVRIRVVDTNRAPGTQFLDRVSIDELFLRIIP